MGVMKRLVPDEVPEEHRSRVDYENQWTDKSPSGKSRAWVNIRCDVCGQVKPTSINDVRNFVRGQRKSKFPGTHRSCRYSGRIITNQGYVWIYFKDHPNAYDGKYVPEHILNMEAHLKRYIDSSVESVHHIDGDRQNNSIENLQLRKRYHGKGQAWKCQSCGSHDIVAVELD